VTVGWGKFALVVGQYECWLVVVGVMKSFVVEVLVGGSFLKKLSQKQLLQKLFQKLFLSLG
jgi:hypothetical protein